MGARILAAGLLVLGLAGCASVPRGGDAADVQDQRVAAHPDVAGLFVYCDEWMGLIPRSNVAIDGSPLGQLGSLTYLHTVLAPGPHRVTATANDSDEVAFDAEAGHDYYVWHEVRAGVLYPGVKLHLMSEEDGKAGTRRTRIVAPSYREEDMQALKRRTIAASFLAVLLGNLAVTAGGGAAIGIGTFAP